MEMNVSLVQRFNSIEHFSKFLMNCSSFMWEKQTEWQKKGH